MPPAAGQGDEEASGGRGDHPPDPCNEKQRVILLGFQRVKPFGRQRLLPYRMALTASS